MAQGSAGLGDARRTGRLACLRGRRQKVTVLLASAAIVPLPAILCDVTAFKPGLLSENRGERSGAAQPNATAEAGQAVAPAPFTRPLPIPPVRTGTKDRTGARNITMHMREADVPILSGPPTRMWTYDGVFPGPTIRVPSGDPTRVKFVNDLPAAAGDMTVHLHGGHNSSEDDGQPDDHLIAPGGERTYNYDLTEDGGNERAAFKWYHDHRMDATARNVWNGLAGMFILDDKFEQRLPLPKGEFDVPLMITDRNFTDDNQLTQPFPETDPVVKLLPETPEIGAFDLVNGASKPYFEVADRKYRLRILNASTFRWYDLRLSNGQEMVQIGTESGLMPRPVRRSRIFLGPAERVELVVDFSGQRGNTVLLESVEHPAAAPDPTSPPPGPLMQFRVSKHVSDSSRVPDTLRPLPDWVKSAPKTASRSWTFSETVDLTKRQFAHTINGRTFDPNRVDARPKLDSVETWELRSLSPLAHWIHIHDVAWYLISRNGSPAAPEEAALKETFRLDPYESVLVAAKFPDHRGKFMIHCHMLEHEDLGMMTQFEVTDP